MSVLCSFIIDSYISIPQALSFSRTWITPVSKLASRHKKADVKTEYSACVLPSVECVLMPCHENNGCVTRLYLNWSEPELS